MRVKIEVLENNVLPMCDKRVGESVLTCTNDGKNIVRVENGKRVLAEMVNINNDLLKHMSEIFEFGFEKGIIYV